MWVYPAHLRLPVCLRGRSTCWLWSAPCQIWHQVGLIRQLSLEPHSSLVFLSPQHTMQKLIPADLKPPRNFVQCRFPLSTFPLFTYSSGEVAQDIKEVEELQRFTAELVRATRLYLDTVYSPMQASGWRASVEYMEGTSGGGKGIRLDTMGQLGRHGRVDMGYPGWVIICARSDSFLNSPLWRRPARLVQESLKCGGCVTLFFSFLPRWRCCSTALSISACAPHGNG